MLGSFVSEMTNLWRKLMDNIIYEIDGDMICAYRHDFINLQESLAGFGPTEGCALEDLLEKEKYEEFTASS